jgi:hypothetical protein
LASLQGQVRTQSVREILRDLGVKPKVADLIPSAIEPTADAVGKWVKDYEDVFGGIRQEEKAQGSEPEGVPAEPARPSIDAGTQDALQRLQQVEAAAGVVPMQTQEAQIAALTSAYEAAGRLSVSSRTSSPVMANQERTT